VLIGRETYDVFLAAACLLPSPPAGFSALSSESVSYAAKSSNSFSSSKVVIEKLKKQDSSPREGAKQQLLLSQFSRFIFLAVLRSSRMRGPFGPQFLAHVALRDTTQQIGVLIIILCLYEFCSHLNNKVCGLHVTNITARVHSVHP
jgi:hypothetical protein